MKHGVVIGTVVLALGAIPALAQEHKAAEAQKPASDQHFATEAAHAGIAEVEIGKLATEKASSPGVKAFAQRMVDDHGKANDELKTLAKNSHLTLPTTMDAAHKAALDRLTKLSGEAFDRAYMTEMVSGHRKVVSMFRLESKSGKDADVKAWAAKTLPTLEEHLKMAQEEAKKPVGTSGKAKSPKRRN